MLDALSARSAGPLVGVDVGGTKTHILSEGEGATIDLVVPSPQWRQGAIFDAEANFDRLAALVRERVCAAPAATVIGAHGIDNDTQRIRAQLLLARRLPGAVQVVNDAVLLAPAMGLADAICVIAGTGSAVVGIDEDGATIAADGHGWLLADDASAPGLARRAFVAVLREVDRAGTGAMADPLAQRLLRAYDAVDHVELALVFQARASESAWGSFAPQVFDAAAEGSDIARRIVTASGRHLAEMVQVVRGRGARGVDVIAAGGVVTAQPLLAAALGAGLAEVDPALRLHVLDAPPAVGALILARRLAAAATAGAT